jgi:hypothetical protein
MMVVGFFKIDPPKTALSQTTDYNRCDALLALHALAASRPKMVDWGRVLAGNLLALEFIVSKQSRRLQCE